MFELYHKPFAAIIDTEMKRQRQIATECRGFYGGVGAGTPAKQCFYRAMHPDGLRYIIKIQYGQLFN